VEAGGLALPSPVGVEGQVPIVGGAAHCAVGRGEGGGSAKDVAAVGGIPGRRVAQLGTQNGPLNGLVVAEGAEPGEGEVVSPGASQATEPEDNLFGDGARTDDLASSASYRRGAVDGGSIAIVVSASVGTAEITSGSPVWLVRASTAAT